MGVVWSSTDVDLDICELNALMFDQSRKEIGEKNRVISCR